MNKAGGKRTGLGALGALLLAFAVAGAAAERVPLPAVVVEKGDKCVEDTAFMRRNHMKLLMHQRDETVHQGIRSKRYSLNGCIECHASRKTNSVIGSDKNFCQSCHSYVAVKLDCFECHSGKPKAAPAGGAAANPLARNP